MCFFLIHLLLWIKEIKVLPHGNNNVPLTWGRMDLEHSEVARELIMQGLFVPLHIVFVYTAPEYVRYTLHKTWGL